MQLHPLIQYELARQHQMNRLRDGAQPLPPQGRELETNPKRRPRPVARAWRWRPAV